MGIRGEGQIPLLAGPENYESASQPSSFLARRAKRVGPGRYSSRRRGWSGGCRTPRTTHHYRMPWCGKKLGPGNTQGGVSGPEPVAGDKNGGEMKACWQKLSLKMEGGDLIRPNFITDTGEDPYRDPTGLTSDSGVTDSRATRRAVWGAPGPDPKLHLLWSANSCSSSLASTRTLAGRASTVQYHPYHRISSTAFPATAVIGTVSVSMCLYPSTRERSTMYLQRCFHPSRPHGGRLRRQASFSPSRPRDGESTTV